MLLHHKVQLCGWMMERVLIKMVIKVQCMLRVLFEMIDAYVKANDDIDPNRVIIGGCSNGGYMTMEMVLKHPTYFAAAFPICEAFQDQYITDDQINAIKDMPIWFTYAKNDGTVDPTLCVEPTVARLLAAGANNIPCISI